MYSMSSYRPAPAMTRVDIAVVNFETLQIVTEIIHQLWAQASAPPPNVTPADDKRPMHWCELSKAGDMYMLCKEGSLVDIGLGCGRRKELVQFLHNCFFVGHQLFRPRPLQHAVKISGGHPKLVWPRGAPCSKVYTSAGKHVVKGPPPEGFTILMSELYETEVGYTTWVAKLAAW